MPAEWLLAIMALYGWNVLAGDPVASMLSKLVKWVQGPDRTNCYLEAEEQIRKLALEDSKNPNIKVMVPKWGDYQREEAETREERKRRRYLAQSDAYDLDVELDRIYEQQNKKSQG